MKESFFNKNASIIVYDLIGAIAANKQYLSDIDGEIGDGDHGINMNKGFSLCKERISESMTGSECFKVLADTLMKDVGGSMGPLYGTFFYMVYEGTKNKEQITAGDFQRILKKICAEVSDIGGAKLGDKTLLDCLFPATEAFTAGLERGFSVALESMKEAAVIGKDATKEMLAGIGRASRLGERSRGHIDAGAASCCVILCSMADSIQKILK